MKLDNLIQDLRQNNIFGNVKAVVYTVEFQKRGLPHAHILFFISKEDQIRGSEVIDQIISAEIPDKELDPQYYTTVQDFMIHGPCGVAKKNSPCIRNGRCSKYFPRNFTETTTTDEDGYPIFRRRDNGRTILKNGMVMDNRCVVPHNRFLLMKYVAHINVEWCNQSRSIKYMFKYVNKGHDRVTAAFYQSAQDEESGKTIDEISMYYDCRYISPCEAAWRIFGFHIQYKYPPVERLSFHLENEQTVFFQDSDSIDDALNRPTVHESMFLAWFEANKKYPEARKLTYVQFPTRFVWKKATKEWVPREKNFSIRRIFFVPLGSGEMYYLRCLLNVVRGPTFYEDIRKINGVQYASFRDACYALGLLDDDKEFIDGIIEASYWSSAKSLRKLFVTLLASDSMGRPEIVWNNCWIYLSDDVLYKQRSMLQYPELHLTDDQIQSYCLVEIEKLLKSFGRTLREFEGMPFPSSDFFHSEENRLINDEMRYDRTKLENDHKVFVSKLTDEQHNLYQIILDVISSKSGGMFFLYGYGGTGKTFIWNTLSAALRSKGEIVLDVASSGIASILLPGGRTAHSRFKISLNPNEDSTCNIIQGSPLAELIVRCKLIIWDEAPMMHKYCFEALDRTLRDIMHVSDSSSARRIFGGKTIIFGGDFRQILPVIPKGTRQDIVHATINSSYLWKDCRVLRLTKNLRLSNLGPNDAADEVEQFANWIAGIGDGTIGGANDGHVNIDIPDDILLKWSEDPISSIVHSTFPLYGIDITDTTYLQERSILAPTLNAVESVNQYMLSLNKGDGRLYLSSDSTCNSENNTDLLQEVHTSEFLNNIRCSGIPNHELFLKVGTPVMLLRNIDHANGLCNGTRLMITRLGTHVIEARFLTGQNAQQTVLIPIMSLTPADPRLPFKFQRRQFPFMPSYAMTINKSQGQSLSHVGLLLQKPVFTHGQLYVAVSRVRSRGGLKILLDDNDSNTTTNVVYREVFQNL